MFSSSFRFVPVIRHDSLETQNKHKPDTSRSFLAKHLLNCLPASPPRMVSGPGARPTGRQPGGDGAIRGEHRRATSKEQRAFGTYAFLSRTPNKSPGALRISGPGQTDKLLSVVPEGRLTREGGSRLVTGFWLPGLPPAATFPLRPQVASSGFSTCGGRRRLQRRVRGRFSRPSLCPATRRANP